MGLRITNDETLSRRISSRTLNNTIGIINELQDAYDEFRPVARPSIYGMGKLPRRIPKALQGA
jgi:hypothetical protein